MWNVFIFLVTLLVRLLRAACKSRDELMLENLALRQQVTTLRLGRPKPRLHDADRAFWIALFYYLRESSRGARNLTRPWRATA